MTVGYKTVADGGLAGVCALWVLFLVYSYLLGAKSFLSTCNETKTNLASQSMRRTAQAHNARNIRPPFSWPPGLATSRRWRRFLRQSVLFADVVSLSEWTRLCAGFWTVARDFSRRNLRLINRHACCHAVSARSPMRPRWHAPENRCPQASRNVAHPPSNDLRNLLLFFIFFPTTETNASAMCPRVCRW